MKYSACGFKKFKQSFYSGVFISPYAAFRLSLLVFVSQEVVVYYFILKAFSPPAPAANPYVGIGTPLSLSIDWLDLFGNRIPNPFNTVESKSQLPYGTFGTMLTYSDALIPLDAWPSTTRAYAYGGEAGTPELTIELVFDPTPYEPETQHSRAASLSAMRAGDTLPVWQRNAHSDLEKLTQAYFQLVQDYSDIGLEGLPGQVVTMAFENTLMATPTQKLTPDERNQIIGYLTAAIAYLTERAAGRAATAPGKTVISRSVDLSLIDTSSEIHQIELGLSFARDASLVAPNLRAVQGGSKVVSSIPANGLLELPEHDPKTVSEDKKYPIALKKFAAEFQKVFQTDDWQMRVGTGSPDPSAPNANSGSTVWAVRMAKPGASSPAGIGYDIGKMPSYFAPLPIASNLVTLQVDLLPYKSGQPYPASDTGISTTLTSVDPNVWLAEALTAIDNVLAATFSTPLYQLDRLLGLTNDPVIGSDGKPVGPDRSGYLWRLLEHKRTLARAISSTATSVLVGGNSALLPAAVDKLEQALLNRLSTANALTAVVVLPVSGTRYDAPLGSSEVPPRLFGQPGAKRVGSSAASPNDNFALTTGKIPLTKEGDTSTLAFLATSRSAETGSYVALELDYALSHVEHDICGVPGIENYQQSRWITLLTGPITTQIASKNCDSFAIPVALRALPQPATVVTQTGKPNFTDPDRAAAADLKSWRYEFSYLLHQAAQDSVMADVVFNQDAKISDDLTSSDDLPQQLYKALAQFTSIYPAVARDLESYLRPITGKTKSTEQSVTDAENAIAALEKVVRDVAKTYENWTKGENTMLDEAKTGLSKVEYTFEIVLSKADEGRAQIEIRPKSFEIGGSLETNYLSPAKVVIDNENYKPVQISSPSKTKAVTWQYQRRNDADQNLPEWLKYETVRDNPDRLVDFSGLDLFALQNGWASVQVLRNRHLSPDLRVKTTPAFEFSTAPTMFANPLVPLIDIPEHVLKGKGKQTITDWLESFFTDLLSPLHGDVLGPLLVRIETSYRYNLMGQADVVPDTILPVMLLTPVSTEGSTNPPFIEAVGNAAQTWFENTNPIADASARFSFDVTVFSAATQTGLPLLRVRNLSLAAGKIKTGG